MGKLLTCLPRLTLAQLRTLRSTTACTCHRDLEIFPSPPGRLKFCSVFAGRRCLCLFWLRHDNVFLDLREYSLRCVCSCSKVPIALMADSHFARCLQGGGVYVSCGTVTITSSSIYGNTARYVRAHVQKFPSPRWEIADAPWETHVWLVVCRVAVSE
jgi:hypothetical protein